MDYYKSIVICGGDQRQKHLYGIMRDKGIDVNTLGLRGDGEVTFEDINKFDVIILPLPVSKDGIYLNAPFVNYKIKLDEIFSRTDKSQTILGGMYKNSEIEVIDYYENEGFQMQNAVPTAEGALQYAMENTDITINSSYCGVLGFGRIGKVMALMLKNMGANVTVYARNPKDIALARIFGFDAFNIRNLYEKANQFDIIFNTVPKNIADSNVICNTKKDVVLIELASKPYGIDMEACQKLNKKVIVASGLPGKVAPKTAGKILYEVIMDILKEV